VWLWLGYKDLYRRRRLRRCTVVRRRCPDSERWRSETAEWTEHSRRWPPCQWSLRRRTSCHRECTSWGPPPSQRLVEWLAFRPRSCPNHWLQQCKPSGISSGVVGPILWSHSGPLCHALSLLLSLRTSILHCHSPGVATVARRLHYSCSWLRLILVVVSTVATPGE